MKFALLGADADALKLAATAARSPKHELVSAHDVGSAAAAIREFAPRAKIVEHWEDLLSGAACEAVIVGRGADDARANQLRKLVQAAVPLVISHPIHESMLVYYELDMIRQESQCPMLPYTPALGHPAIERLTELLQPEAPASLGPLQQLVIERSFSRCDRRTVQAGFVRDMELVHLLCGRMNKVAAMTSPTAVTSPGGKSAVGRPAAEVNFANLGVQMSGLAGALVRWSVSAGADGGGARWNFVGARGQAKLEIPADEQVWKLETRRTGAAAQEETFAPWDAAAPALDMIEQAQSGRPLKPDWLDAANTMELADAVEHSLQRGRTIELQYESASEQSTFKGLMSGIGCFLLIGVLLFVIAATTAVHFGMPLADYWPYALLALLLAFLLLQTLRLAFPHEKE